MEDLTLVGLTEDGSKLVLASGTGEKLTLSVDARLRAAVRGELARLGQGENRMESALRPRDIQARIRAGESPETVAEAAQTTLDRIMTYATPVLAERAHIADRAQRASVRRRAGEGPARVLGDAVADQLRSRNVDPETVDWDSWRREDGRWHVIATFETSESSRRAEFLFDVHGRYVLAEDDDARWLVGEPTARAARPGGEPTARAARPGGEPTAAPARRLAAVGQQEELHLGDDAIELVADADDDVADPQESTVDLTQAARELRRGARPAVDELAVTGDADWMATQASERPTDAAARDSSPQQVTEAPAAPEDRSEPATADQPTEPSEVPEEPKPEEAPEPAVKKSSRRGRRASVPSWDEIMFGGGRPD